MYLYVKALTFDCSDSLVLARFWANVLGSDVDEESTSEKAFVEAPAWGGPNMWFNRVPEPKSAKRTFFDARKTILEEKISLNVSRRRVRPACIAGVLTAPSNFSAR